MPRTSTSETLRILLGPLRMTSSKGEVRSYLLVTAGTLLAVPSEASSGIAGDRHRS